MEFKFKYSDTIITRLIDIYIAITVPQEVFDILYKTQQISQVVDIQGQCKTYTFTVQESVMYYCADEKLNTIKIPIEGLNLYFVLLWLIKQLGKPYDTIGAYTPIVTDNAFHPAKLAMTAVAQVMPIKNPESYSMKDVLNWAISLDNNLTNDTC